MSAPKEKAAMESARQKKLKALDDLKKKIQTYFFFFSNLRKKHEHGRLKDIRENLCSFKNTIVLVSDGLIPL